MQDGQGAALHVHASWGLPLLDGSGQGQRNAVFVQCPYGYARKLKQKFVVHAQYALGTHVWNHER